MDNQPFRIQDCALIAVATGERAQNLRELRDRLKDIPLSSLYYHFWGGLLHHHFDDPEFQNDFARWASYNLHDAKIAEQLSIIDPKVFKDLEELRTELLEIVEDRLAESEHVPWVKSGQEFHFIRSQIVIFDTGKSYREPKELLEVIPGMSLGSIFFHFIDSRRRTREKRNDFSVWLEGFGKNYKGLIANLDKIDPYFTSLSELRNDINLVFNNYFKA